MNGTPLESQKWFMIRKDEYEKYATCIMTEQMSAPEISELFEDKKFYNWYRVKYLRVGSRQFSGIRRSPTSQSDASTP